MASIAKIQHFDGECKKIAKFNGVVAFRMCCSHFTQTSKIAHFIGRKLLSEI